MIRGIALTASILAAAPAWAELPTCARNGSWIELRSRHFVILTDAGLHVGLDVGGELERFVAAMILLNPSLRQVSPLPTTVVVFQDQEELEQYRPQRSENLIAFFFDAEDRNWLVLNGAPQGVQRSEVVFHEFTHCYLSANFPALPMWLDEGLAMYYGTCRLRGGASAEFGAPHQDFITWLKDRAPINIETLFAITPLSPVYQRDSELRNQFYAEAFTLTHSLQSISGGRAERFERFLARLHEGARPMAAFREVFPSSEWDEMVRGLSPHLEGIPFEPTRRVDLPPGSSLDDVPQRSLTAQEALTRLGELQLSLGPERLALATEHFDAALAVDATYAPALAARGLAEDRAERTWEAEGWYQKALVAAPHEAPVLDVIGRGTLVRLRRQLKNGAPMESLAGLAHLVRDRFRSALREAPEDMEAMGAVGLTYAATGEEPDSGAVQGLARAVDAMPRRADLAGALAILRTKQGRAQEAEDLVAHRVAPVRSHADTEELKQYLKTADRDPEHTADLGRVEDWRRQGQPARAESLLEVLAKSASDAAVRDQAQEQLRTLHQLHKQEHLAADYDLASVLVEQGKLEEARAGFRAVRDSARAFGMTSLFEQANRNVQTLDVEIRFRRVEELVRRHRLREAEALLAAADTVWQSEDDRRRRDEALAGVRACIQIGRANDLAGQGKLVEARVLLRKILDSEPSESIKSTVRDQIKVLDAAIQGH